MSKEVAITGIGILSPLGIGKDQFLENLSKGESGISIVKGIELINISSKLAAQIPEVNFKSYIPLASLRRMDRISKMVVTALSLAIKDGGISLDKENLEKIGIMVGTGLGSSYTVDTYFRLLLKEGPLAAPPMLFQTSVPNAICSHASILYGIKGINATFSQKETSVEMAIIQGYLAIKKGVADIIFVGGGDEISEPLYHIYSKLGLLSKNDTYPEGSRPYDKTRNGMVMGEGACILILEEASHAKKRKANIYGYFEGFGIASSPVDILGYDKKGDGIYHSINMATKNKSPDLIYGSANSSLDLDEGEAHAINKWFNKRNGQVKLTAISSLLGSFDAIGGLKAAAALLTIKTKKIPPTINLTKQDFSFSLPIVTTPIEDKNIKNVLTIGSATGGTTITLLFSADL